MHYSNNLNEKCISYSNIFAKVYCRASQVALGPNPSEGGNATIVLVLSHHCQDQLHSAEQPAQIMPHRCTAMEPRTVCKDL